MQYFNLFLYLGDFSTFTILTKSGNPCPQDFSFIEPNHDVWSSPKSRFGSLRRTLSRQSLKYKTPTLQRRSGRFSSMLSLRGSSKMTRKNYKTENLTNNTMNKGRIHLTVFKKFFKNLLPHSSQQLINLQS